MLLYAADIKLHTSTHYCTQENRFIMYLSISKSVKAGLNVVNEDELNVFFNRKVIPANKEHRQ